MDSITELAKLFKERNNPSIQGICVGKVLTAPPELKITVSGFILVVAQHLLKTYISSSETVADHGQHTHTVADVLCCNDKVIVIPSRDDSIYFVMDKVGDI